MANERFTFDSSAVLAVLWAEPGHAAAEALLSGATISAVNVVEVLTKLVDRGLAFGQAHAVLEKIRLRTVAFDLGLALRAAEMRTSTMGAGLSLGDRACLATAERIGAIALTADRIWLDIDVGVPIRLVR